MKKHIQKHVSKLKTRAKGLSTQSRVIVFVLVFGVIGAITLLISNAATPTAQFEAESGTRSGNASLVSDTTASGGSAIVFSGSTTTPPPTYYVSTAGLDTNPGTESSPFKTISKAMSVVQPGQAILVKSGTYSGDLNITKSGTNGNQITLMGESGTKLVTTKSQSNASVEISASYVTLKNFDITGNVYIRGHFNVVDNNYIHDGWRDSGVNVSASSRNSTDCTNNTVSNNKIERAFKSGVYLEGQFHKMLNNDISHIRDNIPDGSNQSDADGMRFFGSGHLIKGNYIHDIWQTEMTGVPHVDMMQTFQEAHDIVFDSNIMHNPNRSGSNRILMLERQAGEGPVSNLTWVNNIFIFEDDGSAFMNFNRKDGQPEIVNMNVINNVFYTPTGLKTDKAAGFTNITNATFKNNLVINTLNYYEASSGTTTTLMGNNAVFNQDGSSPSRSALTGDVRTDPKAVDITGNNKNEVDFHLTSTSPLINKGVSHTFSSLDFEGTIRPQGAGWDIGAFEFK